jgi:hypothetical protein
VLRPLHLPTAVGLLLSAEWLATALHHLCRGTAAGRQQQLLLLAGQQLWQQLWQQQQQRLFLQAMVGLLLRQQGLEMGRIGWIIVRCEAWG